MFAQYHAYQPGDEVRVRLCRDDVRFVAGVVVSVGTTSCVVAICDGRVIRVAARPDWLRKLSLVSTRPTSAPGGAA